MPMNRARLKDDAIHFLLFSSLRYPLCFDMRGKAAKYGLLERLVLKLYYEEALLPPTVRPFCLLIIFMSCALMFWTACVTRRRLFCYLQGSWSGCMLEESGEGTMDILNLSVVPSTSGSVNICRLCTDYAS